MTITEIAHIVLKKVALFFIKAIILMSRSFVISKILAIICLMIFFIKLNTVEINRFNKISPPVFLLSILYKTGNAYYTHGVSAVQKNKKIKRANNYHPPFFHYQRLPFYITSFNFSVKQLHFIRNIFSISY